MMKRSDQKDTNLNQYQDGYGKHDLWRAYDKSFKQQYNNLHQYQYALSSIDENPDLTMYEYFRAKKIQYTSLYRKV